MSEIVIIAPDLHFGKGRSLGKVGIGSNLNSRIVDQLNLLDWLFDQAIERNSTNIIFTGDIFEDVKPDQSLIILLISWLKKCRIHQINCHMILGNHDIIRSGSTIISSLDLISEIDLNNVTVYKNIDTIFIGTTAYTLMPFRDRKHFGTSSNKEALSILKDSVIYELSSIPITYTKVLVGHLAIEGSIPVGDEIDDIANELFCPIEMFSGYDFVWMGHVHTPQIMNKFNPFVAHVGSMDISNFSESEQKKIIVVFDGLNKTFINEKIPTRSLKKISIVIPKDTTDTTSYVSAEIEKLKGLDKSIVNLEISFSFPELLPINKSKIEKLLLSKGSFNVAKISESKFISLIKKDDSNAIDNKISVPGAIKKYAASYVDKVFQDEFITLANEIYETFQLGEK